MRIFENVLLKNLTTFKVGGNARFFVSVHSETELEEAVSFAQKQSLPIFVLGGGSNIVISDEGFSGLVIKIEIKGFAINDNGKSIFVTVAAGENWDMTVERVAKAGIAGIENLSLIPGTVGAAPVQNIGAYGVEIKDVIESVRAYSIYEKKFTKFTPSQCDFSYRNSIFKKEKRFIVVSITLRLSKEANLNLEYKDIQEYLDVRGVNTTTLTPLDVRSIVVGIRKRKLPNWSLVPTAGSFFKNPDIPEELFVELKRKYPNVPGFALDNNRVKIPLAWVIEHICEMKGVQYGGASIYEKHALVIINKDNATASDIRELARRTALCVYEKTGIVVENEVQFIEN